MKKKLLRLTQAVSRKAVDATLAIWLWAHKREEQLDIKAKRK